MQDKELDGLGTGVKRLKAIAMDMNDELDKQNTALDKIETDVDKALDDLDNVNIKMKKLLDSVMKGDKFLVNCILVCIVLALVAFIANLFF